MIALVLAIVYRVVGVDYGLPDLFWHEDWRVQFCAGVSVALLFIVIVGLFLATEPVLADLEPAQPAAEPFVRWMLDSATKYEEVGAVNIARWIRDQTVSATARVEGTPAPAGGAAPPTVHTGDVSYLGLTLKQIQEQFSELENYNFPINWLKGSPPPWDLVFAAVKRLDRLIGEARAGHLKSDLTETVSATVGVEGSPAIAAGMAPPVVNMGNPPSTEPTSPGPTCTDVDRCRNLNSLS